MQRCLHFFQLGKTASLSSYIFEQLNLYFFFLKAFIMLHVCTLEFVSFSFTCFICFVLLFLQYRIVQISSENSFCNLFCMLSRSWPRMAEASRGAKGKALVQYSNGFEEENASIMY